MSLFEISLTFLDLELLSRQICCFT